MRMQKKYKPGDDWLGYLLGNIIWYDLSNPETFEENLFNFLDAIDSQAGDAKLPGKTRLHHNFGGRVKEQQSEASVLTVNEYFGLYIV